MADDHPATVRFVARVLDLEGFSVSTAADADGLLMAWLATRAPVVLSDVGMPGTLDGLDSCRTISSLDPRVRVFLMTGDEAAAGRCAAHGLILALRKPFTLEQLRRWARALR